MPSNLLYADTMFPNFTGEESQEEKIRVIMNYLFMLLEQLRYSFGNIGVENFNDAELADLIHIINEPVYVQLENMEGDITTVTIEAGLLASRISNTEGDISTLLQTANLFDIRLSNSEGNIASLTITANGLVSSVSNMNGEISRISQSVDSISLSVINGEESSYIYMMKNGIVVSSQIIQFVGMVSFSDLAGSGTTLINGDNIYTGTISGVTFFSRESTRQTAIRISDGRISFGSALGTSSWINEEYGSIYADIYREPIGFYIGTPTGKVLKLESGGDMSIDAAIAQTIFIATKDNAMQTVHIGSPNTSVHLFGRVYVNNVLIS